MTPEPATGPGTREMRVFGMSAERGRWMFVIVGLVINLCLGSIYAWSVFRKPLQSYFSVGATESLLPFIIFLAVFAITMPLVGGILDRYGPRRLTVIGGVVVGIGWILGSQSSSMTMLSLTYGIIGGAGVGIVYNAPIGVAGRWFPDRRGLAVGATLLGFGLSPLITAPLANAMMAPNGIVIPGLVLPTLGYMGIAFLVIIAVLGLLLRFPPAGWSPAGAGVKAGAIACQDLDRSAMIRTKGFWGLWVCFLIGTLAGLMAIGISSPVGQEVFALSAGISAALVGVFAVFNGIGRPIFGHLVDRTSPRTGAVVNLAIILVAALLLGGGSSAGASWVYILGFSALWLCLGGWLAIAPACTGAFCGTKYYGPCYGLVFTAYGAGAIAGNLLAGNLRDIFGSYVTVFYPVAILAAIGIAVAYFLMVPSHQEKT
ncbi:MAG: OFA family MFS transporter [Methanoregulaceae archaeon]|nr:OFA family MFS transporter [Methanoregulaceae archaeon]